MALHCVWTVKNLTSSEEELRSYFVPQCITTKVDKEARQNMSADSSSKHRVDCNYRTEIALFY